RMLVVTRGARAVRAAAGQPNPEQATLWGLGTGIETEHPELQCRKIDLDPDAGVEQAGLVFGEIMSDDAELRVAYRGGKRYVERLTTVRAPALAGNEAEVPGAATEQPIALDSSERGTFENLIVRPMDRRLPGPDEVEIRVRATGLNFRDVLAALNEYPDGPVPYGIECAGEVAAVGENVTDLAVGDAVIALTVEQSFASYVTVPADLVIRKPGHLSHREAATIPVVFLTAFYALHRFGRIAPGDRVLIHSAAGGVGLASIQLARLMGAEIFATVSTEEKQTMLRSMGVTHIYNSRSLDFADEILADTGGEGVDIVLNSLAGEFVTKGIGLLRENGRFIEIGKKDLLSAKEVARIKKRVSYFILDLMEVARNQPDLIQSMLLHLAEEFSGGDLQSLPHTTYDMAEVQTAFMDMARGRHIGKLVVEQNAAATDLTVAGRYSGVRADGTYLITGGLGGLGLLFARSLAEQGAGHVVLTGRSAPREETLRQIAEIEAIGATRVHVLRGDVSRESDVIRIVETIDAQYPPLVGVMHTAGVGRDGLLLNMNWEQCEAVLEAKVAGSFYLHKHTRNRALDLFVLFSSIVATVGSTAQANYAAANAYMDGLAHYRRSLGLAGLSVNWGPWADAGMAAELAGRGATNWTGRGISFLPAETGVAALERLLNGDSAQAGVYHIDWNIFADQFSHDRAAPGFFAKFLSARGKDQRDDSHDAVAGVGMLRSLMDAPAPARKRMVFEHVREQISKILGLGSPQGVDVAKGFKEMGLDSLMTVELRNRLQKNLQCTLPSTLAFDYPNVETLSGFLHDQALDFSEAGSGGEDQSAPEPVAAAAAVSEESRAARSVVKSQTPSRGSAQNVGAEVGEIVDRLEVASEDDVLAELMGS
ncbi:MAG: SDR family NAD(P)-dependent oxidoreductase, partial [Leptospirales bacterium]